MDVVEIRRRNLAYIVESEYGGVARQFGLDVGLDSSYVSRIFSDKPASRRSVGNKLARKLEKSLGKPKGWLDRPQWVSATSSDEILIEIIQSVENFTKDIELDPEKKAELIAALYRLISKSRSTP